MNGEVWRLVPSAPQFLASSEGRVMVVPYWAPMPNGQGFRSYGGEPYFGVWSRDDVRFIIVHKGTSYKVSRLVCEAFNGAPPHDRPYCLHDDGNPSNNRAKNLYWGTQKESLNKPNFIAYCEERTGEDSPFVKGRKRRSLSSDDDA